MANRNPTAKVTVSLNGPYLVEGNIPVSKQTITTDDEGGSESWTEGAKSALGESYALCRCGHSKLKPLCDGSHLRAKFDGTETASREPFPAQAQFLDGPSAALADAEKLCAFARFCDPHGQVWNEVQQTDDPAVRATFLKQVANCPSGRLVAIDKATNKMLEPELPISIGLVEDPAQGCSGPLWLRGGIAVVAADGFAYEVRNRVTLCRCGQSSNKPFCDGTHAAIKFRDA